MELLPAGQQNILTFAKRQNSKKKKEEKKSKNSNLILFNDAHATCLASTGLSVEIAAAFLQYVACHNSNIDGIDNAFLGPVCSSSSSGSIEQVSF